MEVFVKTSLFILLLGLSLSSYADIDTYEGYEDIRVLESSSFEASEVSSVVIRSNSAQVKSFIRKEDGTLFEIELPLEGVEKCNSADQFKKQLSANNKFYQIGSYSLTYELKCGELSKLIFDQKSEAGEYVQIWNIFHLAQVKFQNNEQIDFWDRKIKVNWPASGDYYSWGTVNITKGYQWDVVGHELGHAIYDQGNIGSFGGGSHRIDECYTSALALSEGWASYFSAWLKVDRNDPDAKFEFMVPRRAPLRFETIPENVCEGPKNEWRVTGFLWDLIDTNNDQEQMNETFKTIWDITYNSNYRDINSLAKDVMSSGVDPILVRIIYENNFLKSL